MNAVLLLIIITPLLGTALGSFYAAQVMRGEKITKATGPFSVDDNTGERLKWYELIPIFSFLIQRGKSRYTGESLDFRMFLAEFLGLISFLILAVGGYIRMLTAESFFVLTLEYFIFLIVTVAFFYLAVYDLFTYSIPAKLTLLLTLGTVLLNLLFGVLKFFQPELLEGLLLGTSDNLIAALIGGGAIYALIKLTKEKGMGMGDVYIAIIMGIMLGGVRGLASFYITVLGASIIGVFLMIRQKKLRGLIVPLVPFMLLGFTTAFGLGFQIVNLLFFSSL